MNDRPRDEEIPAHRPSRRRQIVQGAITVGVVALVFGFVIPKLADYEDVLESITAIEPVEWAVLATLAVVVLVAYMCVLLAAMRTLRFGEAYVAQTTAQAVNNTLPAGGAIALPLQYAIYLSWGFTPEAVTAMFLAVGIWDQFARFGLPIVALAIAAVTQSTPWWTWAVAAGGVAVVVVAVWVVWAVFSREEVAAKAASFLDRLGNRALGLVKRPPAGIAGGVMRFRDNAVDVVRHRWRPITATTVVNHAAQAGLFLASLRAVGVTDDQVPTVWVVASFAIGRLLTMIPASPGGLGLVDLGWIGLLSFGWQTGSPDADVIAAGILLYRALTYLPPIPLGIVSWVVYRAKGSWRRDWRLARRGDWEDVRTSARRPAQPPS